MNSKTSSTPKVSIGKGEDQSARVVQAQIRKMIELEFPSKSVSDNIPPKMLADKAMPITRRTVSKHHGLMDNPPVTQQKSVL